MNLRHLSMILMFGLTGSAFGQDAQPATVYKLRNVAAADVAKSVTGYAAQKKLTVTVVAEPVTNAVFVSGDAEQQKRVVELMTSLDKQLPTVLVSAMVVEVPLGFAEDAGLGDGDKWVLTARETKMLVAAIHREKSAKKKSEPKMIVTDNKLAFFRCGSEFEGDEA